MSKYFSRAINDYITVETNSNVNTRLKAVQKMHNDILNISDENYYLTWIYTVPDEPDILDMLDIAEDIEYFEEVATLYNRLMKHAKKHNAL